MNKYIGNAISLSMFNFSYSNEVIVKIKKIEREEFCRQISDPNAVNGIGHQGTVDLINQLCSLNLKVNRIMLKVENGDELYIINILERLQEGKVLTLQELQNMLNNGKIGFYKITL